MTAALVVDLETHSADERYTRTPEDFYRIGGALTGAGYRYTTDARTMRAEVQRAPLTVGHNVIPFDIPALGIDVLEMARDRRVLDTMVIDSVIDPPDYGMKPEQAMSQKYALEPACTRYEIPGKQGDLKALAKEFGGFGAIPTDDPRYLSYLEGDIRATDQLLDSMGSARSVSEYAWREMRIAALASNMTTTGFLVDRSLLNSRAAAGEQRQRELIEWLVTEHNIPTVLPNGKEAKSPHATKAGKAALVAAFESVGVPPSKLPRTPKGAISFSAEPLMEIGTRFPESAALCEAIGALVGIRSVYATALKYLHSDGRVHPDVTMFQASGRWSITKPGLTVFGKRGGRKVERDVFVFGEGNIGLSFDLSQVDARAVAAHSQDEAYISLFAPGLDAHELMARMVWGDQTYDSDPKYYRDKIKAITHGSTYGMGVPKLAISAGVGEDEAQRVVTTLRERFPRMEAWKREVRERAEAGELLDNGFGKIMRPDPHRAWTQGPALMGQGTARDILMEGIVVRLPLEGQRLIRGVVHDEVVVECAAEDEMDVRRMFMDAMSFEWCPEGASIPVPFLADGGPAGKRWSECY